MNFQKVDCENKEYYLAIFVSILPVFVRYPIEKIEVVRGKMSIQTHDFTCTINDEEECLEISRYDGEGAILFLRENEKPKHLLKRFEKTLFNMI